MATCLYETPMTSEFQVVMEIAAVGAALLFLALAGLIGLMYLITAPFGQSTVEARAGAEGLLRSSPSKLQSSNELAERELQTRAVALAVAVACAEDAHPPLRSSSGSSEWRHLHRMGELNRSKVRARQRNQA